MPGLLDLGQRAAREGGRAGLADVFGLQVRAAAADRDRERAAAPELALDRRLATVQAGQLADDREPDAGALERARASVADTVEALEQARELVGGDADPGVADRQLGTVLGARAARP